MRHRVDTTALAVLVHGLDRSADDIAHLAAPIRATLAGHGLGTTAEEITVSFRIVESWAASTTVDLAARLRSLLAGDTMRLPGGDVRWRGPDGSPVEVEQWLEALRRHAVIGCPASPEATARFFAEAGQIVGRRLAALRPEVIGPLAGAPLELRLAANRILIRRTLDRILGALSSTGKAAVGGDERDTLERDAATLGALLEGGRRFVLFDWAGSGRIAEWHGPVDAANILIHVPGAGASKRSLAAPTWRSETMLAHDPTDGDLAVVTALVFDTPLWPFPQGLLSGHARAGAPLLTEFVGGLAVEGRHLTLLGHSYGSTAIGHALTGGLPATLDQGDDIVFIASPGVGVGTVDDLRHPADHVWVGLGRGDEIQAAVDPVGVLETGLCHVGRAMIGGLVASGRRGAMDCGVNRKLIHGVNPADPSFGATVFETGANPPPDGLFDEHGEYWETVTSPDGTTAPGTSLSNILAIAVGDYDAVIRKRSR